MKKSIYFMGTGGQAILTAGSILAHAAVENGMEIALNPLYSPEVRGGTSFVEMIVADTPIENPFISHADLIVCLTKKDMESVSQYVDEKTELFSDVSVKIENLPCCCRQYSLKFIDESVFTDARKVGLVLLCFVIRYVFPELMRSAEDKIAAKKLCSAAEWKTIRNMTEEMVKRIGVLKTER